MGDPNAPALQLDRLLPALARHEVEYVLVGGIAGTIHGATRVTFDVDVVPAWSRANRERLAGALRELNARLRVLGQPDPVDFPLDATSFESFEVSTWRTDAGDLDVIVGIPTSVRGRLARYEDLREQAIEAEAFGVTIRAASLADVIESKQALSRDPDLVALPELIELQRRRSIDPPLS